MENEILKEFPSEERWRVIDTLGVPHPYCITPQHLKYCDIVIGKAEIVEAERHGVVCNICKKLNEKEGREILSYEEHKQVVLVEVDSEKEDIKDETGEFKKSLQEYLLKIKPLLLKHNFEGVSFIRRNKTKEE